MNQINHEGHEGQYQDLRVLCVFRGGNNIFNYDANGNQIKTTDAKGNVTENRYDSNNRLVKTIDAAGGITQYEYDINGNRTKVIAPNGATTTFEYDNFNQLVRETSPDRGTTTYAYDVAGNQIKITDANGNTKRISYDLLNRKTGESWLNHPDLTIAYEYDTCRIGALCKTTDQSGSTTLSYDNEGKVTQKDNTIENATLSLKYSYTEDDKLKTVTYPSGKVISYSYDVDKISSITLDGNLLITDIRYNGANQLTGWTWSDGSAYTKTYDTNGRLKTFPLGDQTRTLKYDILGNITGWSDQPTTGSAGQDTANQGSAGQDTAGESMVFTYDLLSRLTGYTKTRGNQIAESQHFSYDANGNRLKLIENKDSNEEIQTIYSILENSNRLIKVADTDYQYDANGNIINDGEHSYTYDARNRLVSIDNGTTASYLYNANNMRVKKTTVNETTNYGWDNDRIFAEYDASGNVIQETVYFGSTPIALLKDGNIYRIFADQIDTPRVITDNTNTTLWVWDSKPFGESQPDEDIDGDNTKLSYNLRFPGQYYDAETGKHYNFNRDYNPVTGRYVQSDPIGLDGGMNGYGYSNSRPLLSFDIKGLSARDVEKIKSIFNQCVSEMTEAGERTSPLFNNIARNTETILGQFFGSNDGLVPFDPDAFGHNLQCHEQTNKVIEKLRAVTTFDDNWVFESVNNAPGEFYSYTWGRGYPTTNNTDPIIYFDPFYNKIVESNCACSSSRCEQCQP